MYLLNQATLATWYRVNHAAKWRNYITVLYSVVLECLGRQTLDLAVFTSIRPQFKGPPDINKILLPDHQASPKISDAMYIDPFYGLGNIDNYYHWNALLSSTENPLARLAWQWELKTYFALTADQV